MMRAEILVFDGVDELDFVGPYEVLARAVAGAPGSSVRLVSLHGPRAHRGQCGLRFESEGPLDAAPDLLLVPGGGWAARSPVGAWGEHERGELTAALAASAPRARLLASVCTGAMLLAASGVITGRRAATHASAAPELAAFGVQVVDERVVDDGDLVSCGGVTSGIDLALHIVEREFGDATAARIAKGIEYPRYRALG